jgi:hypothetical protein
MSKRSNCHTNLGQRALRYAPVALAAILSCHWALSATRIWDGGAGAGDPYWDLVANWNTGLPLAGDIVRLGAFDTTLDTGDWDLQSMSGTGTLSVRGSGDLWLRQASSLGRLILSSGKVSTKSTLGVGSFAWSGGTLGAAEATGGTINISGATTLGSSLSYYLRYGQALNLKGNTTWTGPGRLWTFEAGGSGATAYRESSVNVFAGKALTLQGSASSDFCFCGDGTFSNAGTVTKAGGDTLTVSSKFANSGTLKIDSGEALFKGTRTLTGRLEVASGATLRFNGKSTFDPSLVIAGAGDLVFEGASTADHLVTAGTRSFGGIGTKTFAGGTFGGAGTMVFNRLVWNAGAMGLQELPGGVTTVNGTTAIGSSDYRVGYGRTLNLNGSTTWQADGTTRLLIGYAETGTGFGQSVVNVAAGKTFVLPGDAFPAHRYTIEGRGTLNNAGMMTKHGANSLTIKTVDFRNPGTFIANGGEVSIELIDNGGTLHANGARIDIAKDGLAQWDLAKRTLTGGTYRVTGSQPIAIDLATTSPERAVYVKTNKANIYLTGAAARIVNSNRGADTNALRALARNEGVLSLVGGATLAINGGLTNAGTVVVGSGSALTLAGVVYYGQFDPARTFVGGTLSADSMAFGGGSLSAGGGAGRVGSGVLRAADAGAVTLGPALQVDQDVTTGGWDKLAFESGDLILGGGTLHATFGAGVTTGRYRFLTIGTGSRTGSFGSVTSNLDSSLYTVAAVYGAKFVDLKITAVPAAAAALPLGTVSAVPEVQTWSLFATGLVLLGWRLRRRQ